MWNVSSFLAKTFTLYIWTEYPDWPLNRLPEPAYRPQWNRKRFRQPEFAGSYFANPAIQVLTYWFVFGIVFNRKAVDDIPYIVWMLGGMVVWFFISPCITDGCNAVFRKTDVITKMKFPVSILPMTVILQKLFDHFCLMVIAVVIFAVNGYFPDLYWFGLIYYMLCAILFSFAL